MLLLRAGEMATEAKSTPVSGRGKAGGEGEGEGGRGWQQRCNIHGKQTYGFIIFYHLVVN